MPPKTGSKAGPKGPSSESHYEELQLSDDITATALRLEALKRTYVDRMEVAVRKQQRNLDLQRTLVQAEADLAEKTEGSRDVLTDYTRQYKNDERDKIAAIAVLDATVNRLQEEQLQLEKEISDCESSYDKKIKEKRAQIVLIAQRTAEMEKEFAAMLSDVQRSVEAA